MERLPENNETKEKRIVVQEIDFPKFWSLDLVKRWAKSLTHEEWETELKKEETPLIEIDLSERDLGVVHLKNEGERSVNPTGTHKDRLAKAYVQTYQSKANFFKEVIKNETSYPVSSKHLERFSIITSGNAGLALANACAEQELPPPKLLLDKKMPSDILERLKRARADIYLTDLSFNPFSGKPALEDPLTKEQILELTNNKYGHDLTSENPIDPALPGGVFAYFQLAKEVFQQNPDEVYVPYGSGMLFEGIVYSQNTIDARASILGAEPENLNSMADKLTAPTKPFAYFTDNEMDHYKNNQITGRETGVYKISEEDLKEALKIMREEGVKYGFDAEPSAAAGLALYIRRWKQGLIKPESKVIIVSTGKGLEIQNEQ